MPNSPCVFLVEDEISCQRGLGREAHRSSAATKASRMKSCQQNLQNLLWEVQTWDGGVLVLLAMQEILLFEMFMQ